MRSEGGTPERQSGKEKRKRKNKKEKKMMKYSLPVTSLPYYSSYCSYDRFYDGQEKPRLAQPTAD